MPDDVPDLRAPHADRDRVVEMLRIAAGDGGLSAEELDIRLESALSARTLSRAGRAHRRPADRIRSHWIEDKGLSLVIHTRLTAEPDRLLGILHDPVTEIAAAPGLGVRPGREVLEICMPGINKGTAIRELISHDTGGRPSTRATTSATCTPSKK